GGIVGQVQSGINTLSNVYNIGTVNGGTYVGGITGDNNGTITQSYNSGLVTGTSITGGLVGNNATGSTLSNSLWDTATSAQATATGANSGTVTTVNGGTFDGSSGVNLS